MQGIYVVIQDDRKGGDNDGLLLCELSRIVPDFSRLKILCTQVIQAFDLKNPRPTRTPDFQPLAVPRSESSAVRKFFGSSAALQGSKLPGTGPTRRRTATGTRQ